MRKTGSQTVEYTQKVVQKLRTKIMRFLAQFRLSTFIQSYTQFCTHVMQRIVHILRRKITSVTCGLSPLSTALIIERNMEIKN